MAGIGEDTYELEKNAKMLDKKNTIIVSMLPRDTSNKGVYICSCPPTGPMLSGPSCLVYLVWKPGSDIALSQLWHWNHFL